MVDGLVNDTRKPCENKLYVAVAGPNFDGHEFINAAQSKGACGALVETEIDADIPAVKVVDSVKAMGQIASAWRADFDIPVLGITGSAGKTTLKEMAGSILSITRRGVITEGNLNNDLGVPLTLTRLSSDDEFAVIEMGKNHAGEIRYLSNMAAPNIAIINNAAPAHLDDLGSVEAVAYAKAEIIEGLADDGVLVINADDQYCDLWQSLVAGQRVVMFGLNETADIYASFNASAMGSDIHVNGVYGQFTVNINLPVEHNVRNALAVIAATLEMGCSIEDVQKGLSSHESISNRGGLHAFEQLMLIDDSYNANPVSMSAALNVLALQADELRARNTLVKVFVVLGDMAELGENAQELHQQVGMQANDVANVLYCYGKFARHYYSGFFQGKFSDDMPSFVSFDSMLVALLDDIEKSISTDNLYPLILVKGSRSASMEKAISAIINAQTHDKNNKLESQ